MFRRLVELTGSEVEEPDPAAPQLSFAIAARFDFAAELKQELLQETSERVRMREPLPAARGGGRSRRAAAGDRVAGPDERSREASHRRAAGRRLSAVADARPDGGRGARAARGPRGRRAADEPLHGEHRPRERPDAVQRHPARAWRGDARVRRLARRALRLHRRREHRHRDLPGAPCEAEARRAGRTRRTGGDRRPRRRRAPGRRSRGGGGRPRPDLGPATRSWETAHSSRAEGSSSTSRS